MKKLWFKAKRYGYGWYPCSLEGWVVLAVFLILFILTAANVEFFRRMPNGLAYYLLIIAILIFTLIFIAYMTGEKARWRWG